MFEQLKATWKGLTTVVKVVVVIVLLVLIAALIYSVGFEVGTTTAMR